jgi:ADP-dependent NAD(P)H-hydrate dehydratase / NAD(P)H-hydrate epimerase
MNKDYWHRQTIDKPLFPELEWSRPENKAFAGKLLVIGGNKYGLATPAEAYTEAEKAGVGLTRVLLPLSVKSLMQKVYGPALETEFAATTPSGSFSQHALSEWLGMAAWADATLLAGDLGRNSETAILIEKFLTKHVSKVAVTKDAADYAIGVPQIWQRQDTLFVISMAQLQKLNQQAGATTAITFSMDLIRLVDVLHDLTVQYPIAIITKHLDTMVVATGGQVSTTRLAEELPIWRVRTAAHATVWWLQNPTKRFEALTGSLVY